MNELITKTDLISGDFGLYASVVVHHAYLTLTQYFNAHLHLEIGQIPQIDLQAGQNYNSGGLQNLDYTTSAFLEGIYYEFVFCLATRKK